MLSIEPIVSTSTGVGGGVGGVACANNPSSISIESIDGHRVGVGDLCIFFVQHLLHLSSVFLIFIKMMITNSKDPITFTTTHGRFSFFSTDRARSAQGKVVAVLLTVITGDVTSLSCGSRSGHVAFEVVVVDRDRAVVTS